MIYGYIRVSTDRQDVDNQKLGIIDKCNQLGVVIDKWISDEGISGTKEPEKRALGGLLRKMKKGDIIISSELSRLGRNLFMIMRILEHCMKSEVKVYTVKDGYELGDNITSKVLAFAFGLAAEIERDMISKRTREALAKRKAEGVILGRPVGQRNTIKKCDRLKDDIIKYNEMGLSMSRIGKLLKCHRLTISNFMKENGIIPFHNGANKDKVDSLLEKYKPSIKLFLQQGLRHVEIAKRLSDDYKTKISSSRIERYISNNEDLHLELRNAQNEKRIMANGSMNRSKDKALLIAGIQK
jgi:DNA invertase Pin-like site-specific DNA recombinase